MNARTLLRGKHMGDAMAGMDFKIPTVMTSEELMEKAFHRASKIRKNGTNALDAKKKTALAKVTASGDIVVTALNGYVERFPRLDKEDDFLPVLLPNHYKVRPEQIRAMCSAPTAQAVMEMVEATPYASAFRGAAPEELQNRYGAVLYQLSRRQLRMGKPSVYTAVAYLNLRELELRAVVSAVETVKYQQDLNPALLEFLDD